MFLVPLPAWSEARLVHGKLNVTSVENSQVLIVQLVCWLPVRVQLNKFVYSTTIIGFIETGPAQA